MKMKQILTIFILIIIIGVNNIPAQTQNFSVDAGGDLVSLYIWRGANVNDQPNIQPYISLKYSGLQFGFWGSSVLTHLNSNDENYAAGQEIDTWLSYSLELKDAVSITALFTDYYFPNAGIKIGNFNNYDNANGPGAHTVEAGLTVAGPGSFPVSLSGYVNIYNDKGHNAYFQADYSASIHEINIGLFAGAAAGSKDNPGYYGTDKFNFINAGIRVLKSVKVTDSFSLPVYCSYILNPHTETSFLVFGISL